jgi:hypothetical protein
MLSLFWLILTKFTSKQDGNPRFAWEQPSVRGGEKKTELTVTVLGGTATGAGYSNVSLFNEY